MFLAAAGPGFLHLSKCTLKPKSKLSLGSNMAGNELLSIIMTSLGNSVSVRVCLKDFRSVVIPS